MAREVPFVHRAGNGLIAIHPQRFPRVQNFRISAGQESMLHLHLTFFHLDQGGFVIVIDRNIEDGSAHRNNSSRGKYTIRVGLPQVFDVDSNAADHDVQKVSPIRRVFAKNDSGVRKYFKSAAV
jgi:hypothetical protein